MTDQCTLGECQPATYSTTANSLAIKWCRLLTYWTYSALRFPSVSDDVMHEYVVVNSAPAEEVELLSSISSRRYHQMALLILGNVAFVVKTMVGVVVARSTVAHPEPAALLQIDGTGNRKYLCLATNCTELLNSCSLAQDLAVLPLFPFCAPTLSKIFAPVVQLRSFGVLSLALTVFGAWLIGVVVPGRQFIKPMIAESVMFLTTPQTITKVAVSRIKRHVEALSQSLRNFRASRSSCPRVACKGQYLDWASQSHDEGLCQQELDDYIPVVRSAWWREQMARTVVICNLVFASSNLLFAALAVYYIHLRGYDLSQQILSISRAMNALGCTTWIAGSPERKRLDFSDGGYFFLRWSVYAILETLYFCILPIMSIGFFIGYAHAIGVELNCWLAELHYQLLMVTEVLEIRSLDTCRLINESYRHRSIKMSELKNLFITGTDTFSVWQMRTHRHLGTELVSRIWRQKVVLRWTSLNQVHVDTEVEFLSKMYVNLRLFTKNISLLNPVISTVIMGAYLMNFGVVALCIWLNQTAKDLENESMFVITFCWMLSNIYVFMAANFHAKAKRLNSLIWHMVARLSNRRGARIEHLSLLWLKQIHQLDREGGLYLSALHFRITHVNLLQMMISTSTIIVIAIRR